MKTIQAVIYKISINGQDYIGSTINYSRRIAQHKANLKSNTHCNKILQNYWNKYKVLNVSILEHIDENQIKNMWEIEKKWIEKLNAKFNIQDPETNFTVKPVYKFDLEGNLLKKYSSVSEASKDVTCSYSSIIHCAQEKENLTKSAGGFQWSYSSTITKYHSKKFKKIYVYDIEGNYLKEYDSMKEICIKMFSNKKFIDGLINRICKNKSASIEGYRFSYEKLDKLDNSLLLKIGKNYPIVQYNKKKEKLKVWNTIKHASEELKLNKFSITTAIISNGSLNGFYFTRLGI
jgi:hypothetical protein